MTDPSLTLAGAAIPKAPQELTGKRGGSRKCECFECGTSGLTSRARIRNPDTRLYCKCGTPLVPSLLEDCADLAPDLLPRHPLYVIAALEEQRDQLRAAPDEWCDGARGHCECGWRMPAGADPDYFYCRKCGKVNERQLDGSMGSFAAAPFSAEVEEANGRVCRAHAAPVDLDAIRPATREERAQYERDRAAGADLPF